MIICLGLPLPVDSSDLYPGRGGQPHNVPYLVLLQMGFT